MTALNRFCIPPGLDEAERACGPYALSCWASSKLRGEPRLWSTQCKNPLVPNPQSNSNTMNHVANVQHVSGNDILGSSVSHLQVAIPRTGAGVFIKKLCSAPWQSGNLYRRTIPVDIDIGVDIDAETDTDADIDMELNVDRDIDVDTHTETDTEVSVGIRTDLELDVDMDM